MKSLWREKGDAAMKCCQSLVFMDKVIMDREQQRDNEVLFILGFSLTILAKVDSFHIRI